MLLALDTSTSYASVALVRGERLAAEITWDVGRRHSQELLARLEQVLAMCQATPADLTAVAVARGPGSFNGVRVALATARSLAFALRVPLYGCSTLDAIARGHAPACGILYAVLEAGRGEVYAARYTSDETVGLSSGLRVRVAKGLWRVSDYEVVTPAALADGMAASSGQPVLVCGEWRGETRTALEAALGSGARFADELGGRRASWVAELAWERWASGASSEADTIGPLYLRRPAITVSTRYRVADADSAAQGSRR
jgi:tRNA threonylcarbamoyladenosine biosynthesis protein TsaB